MKYQAILFDLDGTLLPMDYDAFMKGYFGLLAQSVAPLGYSSDTMIPAMWEGVKAMVKNDGSRKNSEAFWERFSEALGFCADEHIPYFDAFYENEFHAVRTFTQPNPLAKAAVETAHRVASKVILATNPLFPEVAVRSRLSWTGIAPEDFDWITHYDNSGTCKPNPAYYLEIAEIMKLDPKQCLMVGNHTQEDARAAMRAGFETYLVTDCLIAKGETPPCKQGSLAELVAFLES